MKTTLCQFVSIWQTSKHIGEVADRCRTKYTGACRRRAAYCLKNGIELKNLPRKPDARTTDWEKLRKLAVILNKKNQEKLR